MVEAETFIQEVRAMERTLYRVARSYLPAWEECADAVQEALTKAWAKRGTVSEERFRPWLTRIVINECHNLGRRRKRMTLVEEVQPPPSPAPAPELKDELSALPEKLRMPLLLHYLEGFALEDVAHTLRLPLGTVKSRLHQGRKELRLQLEKEDGLK